MVSPTRVPSRFDGGGEIAHLAGRQAVGGLQPQGTQAAALDDLVGGTREAIILTFILVRMVPSMTRK